MSRLILIPPSPNYCRYCRQPNPSSSNYKLPRPGKKISNDSKLLKHAYMAYPTTLHLQSEVESSSGQAKLIESYLVKILPSPPALEPIVSILREDPFLQQSLHQVLLLHHGTFRYRPRQHAGHLLFQDHQLHQDIHLHDQIRSRNAAHPLDQVSVDPPHQLLPFRVIIDLHQASPRGKTSP